jgi:hypothetical protein
MCVAGILTVRANTIVTFSVDMGTNILNNTFVPGTDTISVHGSFNSWGAGVNLVQQGSGTVYTNTVDDTGDANGGSLSYKFVDSDALIGSGGYESLCDGGGNRAVTLPAASGSSLALPTPFFADDGAPVTYTSTITFQVDMAQQVNLGTFNPNTDTIQVSGNFNGWTPGSGTLTADPAILRTNQYGLVTSNVFAGTFTSVAVSTNAHMAYKYVLNGTYGDNPSGANNDGGGNRFYTMLPVDQTNPIVFYDDAPYAPLVTNIEFSVDMSVVAITDTNFNPASVTVNGDLMGWGGVAMTNNPTAANTNIYTCIQSFTDGVGATVNYQYRYTLLNSPSSTVYDHANGVNGGQGNRVITIPNVNNTNFLSVFNDASLGDYLLKPTAVLFSVDMAGAMGTDSHSFSSTLDAVYINGTFANWYTWAGGANPTPAPGSSPGAGNAGGPFLMVEQGTNMVYTNTLVIPPGPVVLSYKYGLDPNEENGGPLDDEAISGQNHGRVVRSLAFNPYVMAQDKFGDQYVEPYFSSSDPAGGDLTIGQPIAGKVPVEWLGRPGAHLQANGTLTGGAWQDLWVTDGTNWTSGFTSTNGFVSQTNWPAAGIQFFRLVNP